MLIKFRVIVHFQLIGYFAQFEF